MTQLLIPPPLALSRPAGYAQFNYLDGPPDSSEPFSLILPFDKLRMVLDSEESRRRDAPVLLDAPGIHTGFTFGLMDIVAYPFWFMLLYDLALDKEHPGAQLWNVNANLINHFYPSLHRLAYVLTIAHFNEEPIDDAPIHNIVLWPVRWPADAIRENVLLLAQSGVPTHYVCAERPIMDDRYCLHERRAEDGQPFNLLDLAEHMTQARA